MVKSIFIHFLYIVVALHFVIFFRYSMSSCMRGDHLWLVGGVGLQQSPDIIVANLLTRIWYGIKLKVSARCQI